MNTDINANMSGTEIAYRDSKEFKTYVDAYAESRQISVNEALRHKIVESVLFFYNNRKK